MNNQKCDMLLQRAYESYKSGINQADTSGFDLCNEELNWLVSAGYIQMLDQWVQGGRYCITDLGIKFKEH